MRIITALAAALTVAWVGALASSAIAQECQHSMTATAASSADTRQLREIAKFPYETVGGRAGFTIRG